MHCIAKDAFEARIASLSQIEHWEDCGDAGGALSSKMISLEEWQEEWDRVLLNISGAADEAMKAIAYKAAAATAERGSNIMLWNGTSLTTMLFQRQCMC
jgi:hypothetical protein